MDRMANAKASSALSAVKGCSRMQLQIASHTEDTQDGHMFEKPNSTAELLSQCCKEDSCRESSSHKTDLAKQICDNDTWCSPAEIAGCELQLGVVAKDQRHKDPWDHDVPQP